MKGTEHSFQQIGIRKRAIRSLLRRFKEPAQIARRSSRFIARGQEKEDIAKQLTAAFNKRADNAILSILWSTFEGKVHDKSRFALYFTEPCSDGEGHKGC